MDDELHVEVTCRHSERADHRVHMQRGERGIDGQVVDAGFLCGFTQRGGDDIGIGPLAMAAELQPPAEARVQGQQRAGAGVVEDERRTRDMARHALAKAAVGACGEERQHRVPQRVLRRIGCVPTCQRFDGRLVQTHLRTSRPAVSTGSRGPDDSSG
ncbi:MAG: hypothetical protein NVSMB60_16750 [Mycobacterium sp.]